MPDGPGTVYVEVAFRDRCWSVPVDPEAIFRIGRATTNHILLADDLVSRYHAVIQRTEDDRYLLADLGSRNGTFLNDTRVNAPVILRDSDRITIGTAVITFRMPISDDELTAWPDRATNASLTMRTVSAVVIDIRDSTSLWSGLDPAIISKTMLAFNTETGVVLRRARAWSEKYGGDGVMALWMHAQNAPPSSELQLRIIRSILEIADIATGLQSRFSLPFPVRIGAGVDTGPAIVGNIGSDARSDHTALGDAVNRAFRLEAATREVACDVAVSEDAYHHWQDLFPELDFQEKLMSLKGFPDSTRAYAGTFHRLRSLVYGPNE
ncbi:MAG: adenylate/guanylate cyclase domain-containing protein [Acidobacteriia bacterium]|nr:adenylate/guanylate cyclase domain-containing protein [Terriglobia bacterium]